MNYLLFQYSNNYMLLNLTYYKDICPKHLKLISCSILYF